MLAEFMFSSTVFKVQSEMFDVLSLKVLLLHPED
jgi:hypothetical protein